MSNNENQPGDASQVAAELAAALDSRGCEYAVGGAIALGFWAEPRGTLDVDVTLYFAENAVQSCLELLADIGCQFDEKAAQTLMNEHAYCQAIFGGRRIDVFLPTIPLYEAAFLRRCKIEISGQPIKIWDAETLCVFKLMFFRRKDIADVEQILKHQAEKLDRDWITKKITDIYEKRDPRVSQWKELEDEFLQWARNER